MSYELEDDEVLVYDWKNSGVQELTGTTRLGDGRRHLPQQQSYGWAASAMSNPYQLSQNYAGNYASRPGNWYDELVNTQQSPPRFNPYPYNEQSTVYGSSYCPLVSSFASSGGSSFTSGDSWAWEPNHACANYSQRQSKNDYRKNSSNSSAEIPKIRFNQSDHTEAEDNGLLEFDEFDYSESKYRSPQKKAVNSDVNSRVEAKSPSSAFQFQVEEVDYSIPIPSLPLHEILPEFENKAKCPSIGNLSRKRPRNELEKGDSLDLVDLLCKKGGRASSRSYAKPTRRVGAPSLASPSASTSGESTVSNTEQHERAPVLINHNSPGSQIHHAAPTRSSRDDDERPLVSESMDFDKSFELEKEGILIETSQSNIDPEPDPLEGQLKIRNDIFEDDDD